VGTPVPTQTRLRPVTTCVRKPEAANTVRAPDDDELAFPLRLDYGQSPHAYVKQKLQIQLQLLMMNGVHVEPSMNGGIINSITRLHLVGYFS
jgi:hypothetical protein